MVETIKGWTTYIASMLIGTVGFLQKCSELLDLVFVTLGIIGLILSIRLSLAKLKKLK